MAGSQGSDSTDCASMCEHKRPPQFIRSPSIVAHFELGDGTLVHRRLHATKALHACKAGKHILDSVKTELGSTIRVVDCNARASRGAGNHAPHFRSIRRRQRCASHASDRGALWRCAFVSLVPRWLENHHRAAAVFSGPPSPQGLGALARKHRSANNEPMAWRHKESVSNRAVLVATRVIALAKAGP